MLGLLLRVAAKNQRTRPENQLIWEKHEWNFSPNTTRLANGKWFFVTILLKCDFSRFGSLHLLNNFSVSNSEWNPSFPFVIICFVFVYNIARAPAYKRSFKDSRNLSLRSRALRLLVCQVVSGRSKKRAGPLGGPQNKKL